MRDEEPQIGHCHVLRIAVGGLKVVRADHLRERVPGLASQVVVARCADRVDTLLQAIEGGSFYGYIGPF